MLSYNLEYNGQRINYLEDVNEFKAWNLDSVATIENIEGLHTPEVRNSESPLMGRHWIRDYYSFVWKRWITITWRIVWKNEVELEKAIRDFKIAFSLPAVYTKQTDGYHWLNIDNEELDYHYKIRAKISVFPNFIKTFQVRNYRKFQLTLKAADPRLYSQTVELWVTKRTWYQAGVRLPAKLPIRLETTSVRTITLENTWTIGTAPIIKIYWPTVNPRILSKTHWFEMWLNYTVAEDEIVTIDVINHTIVSSLWTNLINNLTAVSQWFWLYPWDNLIEFTDTLEDPFATGIVPDLQKISIEFNSAIL